MLRRTLTLLVLLIWLAQPLAVAQDDAPPPDLDLLERAKAFGLEIIEPAEITKRERFELFNRCRPMALLVEGFPEDAGKINLTEESIEMAAESRLRSARLYDNKADTMLYINVNVVKKAFSIIIEYSRLVFEPISDEWGRAVTWQVGSTGAHGRSASYIRSGVSEKIAKFLVEYLRVNEKACK